jgi:hypothetical protein
VARARRSPGSMFSSFPGVTRRLAVVLIAALALVAAGCGNKEDETKVADSEGLYLDLGGLKYQVQISRQLNPNDVEDRSYLEGVAPALAKLGRGDSWFAVFMRVENNGDKPLPAASTFTLRDTQDNTFVPVPIARFNPFAYRAAVIPPKNNLPPAQSVAQLNESIGGSLVLFRVPVESYANRPLELTIRNPRNPHDSARVDLDV